MEYSVVCKNRTRSNRPTKVSQQAARRTAFEASDINRWQGKTPYLKESLKINVSDFSHLTELKTTDIKAIALLVLVGEHWAVGL